VSDLSNLLGLTEYEGRVYRAMLVESPATAYRLGKASGVPLSKVYEAVARLVEKGAAAAEGDDPVRYVPVAPATLIEEARARTNAQLETLDRELTDLFNPESAATEAWIFGESNVLARIAAVAAQARRQVLVSCSPDSRARLASYVRTAGGVLLDFLTRRDGDGQFSALIDGRTAVVGSLGSSARALVSEDAAFTTLLSDYFRLQMRAESAAPRVNQPPVDLHADWLDWEKEKQDRLLGIRIPVKRQ
jgi:hypothetical protein